MKEIEAASDWRLTHKNFNCIIRSAGNSRHQFRCMAKQAPLRRFWKITAGLLMWQLLVVYAMAASPEIHECCHEHSQNPAHTCVVDLILQGGWPEELPDITPVDLTSEPPQVLVVLPVKNPGDGIGSPCGILADAPPRGP